MFIGSVDGMRGGGALEAAGLSCRSMAAEVEDLPGLVKAMKSALPGDGSIESLIDSATFDITSREFTRLITACRSPKQWRKAIEILEVAKRMDPTSSSHSNFFTYSAAISVCCKSGRLKEGLRLLKEMKEASMENPSLAPDSVVYRLLVACCMKHGKHRQAVDCFWECICTGLEPDDQTLQHALKAMIGLKEWSMAGDVLDKLHGRRGGLPLQEYTKFITACCADGNLQMATEVLLTMQMVGVSPDMQICGIMLLAIRAAGLQDLWTQFQEEMRLSGIPNLPTMGQCTGLRGIQGTR